MVDERRLDGSPRPGAGDRDGAGPRGRAHGSRAHARCPHVRPASPDSLWAIGSIGKAVTAVLALQLADEGELDLHAPLTDYVAWLSRSPVRADHAAPPADAHLRAHRQLRPRAGVDVGRDRPDRHRARLRARRALPLLQRRLSRRRGRPRGGRRAAPYEELVQRRVLDPLGMRASVPVMRARHAAAAARRPRAALRRPSLGARARARPRALGRVGRGGRLPVLHPDDLAAYLRALWTGDACCRRGAWPRMRTAHARGRTTATAWRSSPVGSATAGTCSAMSRTCGPTRSPGSASSPSSTGSAARWLLAEGALAIAAGEEPRGAGAETPRRPLVDDGTCPPAWSGYRGRYRAQNPWLPTFAVAARERPS